MTLTSGGLQAEQMLLEKSSIIIETHLIIIKIIICAPQTVGHMCYTHTLTHLPQAVDFVCMSACKMLIIGRN